MTLPPLPALVREIENCITARHLDAALALCSNLRAAIAAVPAQPVAALMRSRFLRTRAAIAHDMKDHFSEWGGWIPTTYEHAKAVTDPSRNTDPLLYEMQPLYAAPQAVPVPADMALTDDPWRKLYRRAINEANGLTNYVEDRPELRGAERRLAAIEAEARTLAAALEPTPEKKP